MVVVVGTAEDAVVAAAEAEAEGGWGMRAGECGANVTGSDGIEGMEERLLPSLAADDVILALL